MKTLIFNGAPRKNGDTEALVNELAKNLVGDVKIISCYNDISPCIDCRYCWDKPGCCIDDEMQTVYSYLDECDNVVLASPIWFSSLSGPLLNLASRMQTNFAARFFRHEAKKKKQKRGVIILVGGEIGTEIMPTQNALTILKFMDVHRPSVQKIYSLDTNNLPAKQDTSALEKCRMAAESLNKRFIEKAGNEDTGNARHAGQPL